MSDSKDEKVTGRQPGQSRREPPPTFAAGGGMAGKGRSNVDTSSSQENQKKTFAVPAKTKKHIESPVGQAQLSGDKDLEVPPANNWVRADHIRDWRFNDRSLESLRDDPEWPGLLEEIRLEGVVQPILVRPLDEPEGDYTHEQVAGFRRLSAARSIDPKMKVPVFEQEMTLDEAVRKQAVENRNRSNPSVWDYGLSYKKQWDSGVWEHKRDLAELNKTSRENFSNFIGLIENMPEEYQRSIRLRKLSFHSLKALINETAQVSQVLRNEFIDRIVEVSDDLDDKPDKATTIIANVARKFEAEHGPSVSTAKQEASVYRSQKGKTLTTNKKFNRWDFTIHKDVFDTVDAEALERVITEYLESQGLTLDKVVK